MPKEIDCPDKSCDNCNRREECYGSNMNPHFKCFNYSSWEQKEKITVYTQEELNKAIQEEREECAKICDTERMILIDNNIEFIDLYNLVVFAEAIRNRKGV